MEETSRHYCMGCKKKHDEASWRWKTIFMASRKRYFCHECIACEGCKTVHKKNGYSRIYAEKSRIFPGMSLEICAIWAKPKPLTPQKKMQNMSPEDVLSGVPFGADRASYFKQDSRNDWSKEHEQDVGALKGAIKEL